MTVIENIFDIGQVVYLKTDPEKYKRIVGAFIVYRNAEILYRLFTGESDSDHYEFEITTEKEEE